MTDDRMIFDVLLVGASPSNLVLAHRLLDLKLAELAQKPDAAPLTIGILEKASQFGGHICSGAVSNPRVLKKIFPALAENPEADGFPIEGFCKNSHFKVLGSKNAWTVPNALLPPGLKKEGYFILTLSRVVEWLAQKLEEKAAASDSIHLELLPGFAAHKVVYEGDNTTPLSSDSTVTGVQVMATPSGNPAEDNIYGSITCFGDKGFVSRDLIEDFKLRDNPQIWSVGVKEVWELPEDKDYSDTVWHTMGYPLLDGSFGGGFVYGMNHNRLSVGLIASLDSPNPNLNPQKQLQEFKKHPWLQEMLKGGKLLKYGAAVLPEGGYYSLPKQFQVNGALLLGDALGVLDVSALSGVDKAMECGYIAAEVIFDALAAGDMSAKQLSSYQSRVMESFVGKELYQGRYFRQAWQENPRLLKAYLPTVAEGIDGAGPLMGPISGMINVGLKNNPLTAISDALRLKTLLDGQRDLGKICYKPDFEHIVPSYAPPAIQEPEGYNPATIYSRPDAVFYAEPHYHEGNRHIDEFNAEVCVTCIGKYDALGKDVPCVSDCTAEVHRVDDVMDGDSSAARRHGMSLENCVQCRTCEIICPEVNLRVNPAEQGSGPVFIGL
ncbi:MAG: electron-transfer flavoprotein:ubiquinone oxidoreductase [Vampirovibrionales bacterium]|nr:electron-transfer flavoprotein:ubiquinone oxidoreductase [Vampirovibrionales bacterium]